MIVRVRDKDCCWWLKWWNGYSLVWYVCIYCMNNVYAFICFVWSSEWGYNVVFRKTVVGDILTTRGINTIIWWRSLHLTLKMTTAQVVKTSVTNNSLSKDYPRLDDHPNKQLIPLGSNHLLMFMLSCGSCFTALTQLWIAKTAHGRRTNHQTKLTDPLGLQAIKQQLPVLVGANWPSIVLSACYNLYNLLSNKYKKYKIIQ